MNLEILIQEVLGKIEPWYVDKVRFVDDEVGKDMEVVGKIQEYLTSKGCEQDQLKYICMNMSTAYISGSMKEFPEAQITFDRFHVMHK